MDSYVKAITLDVNADENYTIIKAKQGDKINRKIAITLKKDGANFTPTGVSQIWFRVQKPDKNIAIVKSTDSGNPISSAGNVYTVTLSEQCLTASGKAWCDLAFLDSSGNTLSSCAFILNIIPMPNGNTARSISEWTDLQQAIDDAERFASIVAFRTSGNYIQYTVDGTTWVNLTTVGAIGGDLQTQINALNGAINNEKDELNAIQNNLIIEQGGIRGATGEDAENNARLRTKGYLPPYFTIIVNQPTTHNIRVLATYYYDENNNFVQYLERNSYRVTVDASTNPNGYKVRLAFWAENTTDEITPSDLIISAYQVTDGIQTQIDNLNNAINSLPVGKVYHVGTGQTYTTLRAGIEAATQQKNSVVYVHTGTYDLTQEFATELAGNMSAYTGLKPYNGVHIIGEAGAVVTAIFDTVNQNRYMFFSPFVAVSEHDGSQYTYCDFTIENLTIKAKDCRYCVHDDPYGQGTYTHRYINCVMELENTMSGQNDAIYIQCIGGGLGEHSTIIVDGGIYKSTNTVSLAGTPSLLETQCAISYHNSNYSNAVQSVIFIKDVTLLEHGFFRFQSYGSSTNITDVYLIGCKTGLPTVKGIIGNATDNIAVHEYNENPFTPKSKLQKHNLVANWLMDEGGSIDGTYLPINQRGQTSYSSSNSTGKMAIDGWILAFTGSMTLVDRATGIANGYDAGYIDVTLGDGTNAGQLFYNIEVPLKAFEGMEMTLSILMADGTLYSVSGITAKNPNAPTNSLRLEIGNCVGLLYQARAFVPSLMFTVDAGKTQNMKIRAVKLEFGLGQTIADFDASTGKYIIQDPFPDKAELLNTMQRYYQLYTSSSARPSNRIDCRPTMYKNPTQGTVSIGGTTYYYNEATL